MQFKNSIIIVTGGTRGIGRELVLTFAKLGAIVYTIYSKDDISADILLQQINENKLQDHVTVNRCSILDYDALKKFARKIKDIHHRIDILINNAGVFCSGFFSTTNISELNLTIDTNYKGTLYISHIISRMMISQKAGIIINMASITAFDIYKGVAIYSSTKAAIVSFTKSIALELLPFNIKVYGVAPALVNTGMNEVIQNEFVDSYKKEGAKLLNTKEISDKILSLCSVDNEVLTGKTICIGF